jgi:ATP-binding cassette subfamily B protein
MKGSTGIFISHRLNMMVNFDYIYVIEKGRICEQGTHDYLLSLHGIYAAMWANQSGFTIDLDYDEAEITPQRLQLIPLFNNIPLNFLSTLVEQFNTEKFVKNEEIISEGELGDKFYIIVRGRVEVLKKLESGEQKSLAILEDGDYFGEIALIREVTRTASVRALIPTMCITLRRTEFINLLSLYPELRDEIEHMVKIRQGL